MKIGGNVPTQWKVGIAIELCRLLVFIFGHFWSKMMKLQHYQREGEYHVEMLQLFLTLTVKVPPSVFPNLSKL